MQRQGVSTGRTMRGTGERLLVPVALICRALSTSQLWQHRLRCVVKHRAAPHARTNISPHCGARAGASLVLFALRVHATFDQLTMREWSGDGDGGGPEEGAAGGHDGAKPLFCLFTHSQLRRASHGDGRKVTELTWADPIRRSGSIDRRRRNRSPVADAASAVSLSSPLFKRSPSSMSLPVCAPHAHAACRSHRPPLR